MEKIIKISEVNVSSFKNLGIMKIPISQNETYIVGRNSSGKSSILEAILWTFFDCDRFGANINPLSDNSAITVTGNVTYMSETRIIKEATRTHSSTKKRVYYGQPKVSKKKFIAVSNPMHAINMTAASLKDIIIECSPLSTQTISAIVGDIWEDIVNKHIPTINSSKISIVYEKVDEKISELNKSNKITAENLSQLYGQRKILTELINEGICIPDDVTDNLSINIDETECLLKHTADSIEELKSTKEIIAITATNEFSKHLNKLHIQTVNPEGKDVYFLTYDGKNIKNLSNSELLNAGLEFCNSLMEWMNISYPVIIDNGESVLNIDFSQFPQISQVIATLVSDENLSTWSNGTLVDIISKTPMKRTKEAIMPHTSILCDWTNIRPTKEVATT